MMLHTPRALTAPLKMLNGLEAGWLGMHAADYRAIARSIHEHLDTLSTGALITIARGADGALGEMAESAVFDRACCLVIGERSDRLAAEHSFESLMDRLLDGRCPAPRARS